MATNDLSAELLRAHFTYDPDTGYFVRLGESAPSGRIATKGYRQIAFSGRRYMAHRLAWLYVYGKWPEQQLDHINQDKDDNRLCNLREASNKQNAENITMFKHNTSGRRGVYWHENHGAWVAGIKHHKKSKHLGCFDNIIDAVAARIRAEVALFTHTPSTHFFTHNSVDALSMRGSMAAPGTKTA